MKMLARIFFALGLAVLLPLAAHATNGDNLIGVGPISRAMGGVGIAAPQDAISATFANPAAMCVGPFCPSSEFDFAATLFAPTIEAKITIGGNELKAESDKKVYLVPAFGISAPINKKLRLGLSAYGVTGLGVDYRDTEIAGLSAADATQLMILKVAPSIAYQVNDKLSLGAALHVVNSALDLNQGSSFNYGIGGQLGILYRLSESLSFGATYISPINVDHQNVYNLDEVTRQSTDMDDFKLEAPQTFGLGLAFEPNADLLLELDTKWLNWSDANGYDVMDWDDQLVLALGAQLKPADKLTLRLGYNYAENQINEHHGFDGAGNTEVQGKNVLTYGFESLRVIGFPAVAEHHATVGLGYDITPALSLNFGYMHAFESTLKGSGTIPIPQSDGSVVVAPVEMESRLSEDAVDFSLAWRF
ncbi:outer membrane protein transport protein [Desulfuromonas sp.]|uniref:OmpP1/FadL family transporter n=1 Tax=Desulfuromonas sp. TaxID=892 RepID=UPI0025C2E709|nr:outer membrane protein transport protein [Desulfuromonas sp.]